MCIIAAKPAGIQPPSDEILSNMWAGNPDGAGFMWVANNRVHISKGFMRFTDFCEAYEKLKLEIDIVDTPVVFHFRITTHGGTTPENCHPFPITDQLGLLRKLKCSTDVGVAHNGIISITPRKGISDTMEYIASQLAPLKKSNRKFMYNKHLRQLIANATSGSRICFLTSDGMITTIGNFVAEDGILYSNHNFRWSARLYGGKYDYDFLDYGMSVCDISELGGEVEWGGNIYRDEGMFFFDKDGVIYLYDWEEDGLFRLDKNAAKIHNPPAFNKDLAILMEFVGDYDDYIAAEEYLVECKCCGTPIPKDEAEIFSPYGFVCPDCNLYLQDGLFQQ